MADLDEFHKHEALHTAHLLTDTWHAHVQEHPFVLANDKIAGLAEKAAGAMNAVY